VAINRSAGLSATTKQPGPVMAKICHEGHLLKDSCRHCSTGVPQFCTPKCIQLRLDSSKEPCRYRRCLGMLIVLFDTTAEQRPVQ